MDAGHAWAGATGGEIAQADDTVSQSAVIRLSPPGSG